MADGSDGLEESVKAYVVEPLEAQTSLWLPPSDLSPTEKAIVTKYQQGQQGPLTQAPNAFVSDYETVQAFALAGALAPPEDPRQVANVYRRSSALRPCVEAIATNVVGFGHSFEPTIDLEHADSADRIREAIIQDRIAVNDEREPTDKDIEETRASIEKRMLRERFRLERFFGHVCPTRAFDRLRWESQVELHSGGNAFWEVTRRGDGSIATWDRIEAHTMRLRRTEAKYYDVDVPQRRSPLNYETVPVPMRFRTYVQIVLGGAKAVYFKQYLDKRVLSSATGRWYATRQLLEMSEPSSPPATEIIHWSAFDTIGPYGLPPWYGAQYAVMGILASERVNYDYFDQSCIPPYAIFISGGKLRDGSQKLLEETMKNLKGQANRWKTLILEAEGSGAGPGARCKIEIHPLITRSEEDAMFQQYEAQNAKKIQQQWRLPDLLVGRSEESNKAQAEAALEMAEQQVMDPKRQTEDDFYNRFVLPEMGILFWKFKTNSAVARDPELQTDIGTAWVKAGVLTPNEGRGIAGDVLNKDFPPIDDAWGNIPQPLILAGIMPGVKAGVAQPVGQEEQGLAQRIIALRDTLRGQAESGAAVAEAGARAQQATKTLRLGKAEWAKLVEG